MKEIDTEVGVELHKISEQWHEHSMVCQSAHYDAGNFYEKLFLILGCTVVVLSAAIGSAEVLVPSAKITEIGGDQVKAISGVISLFVAILAGLQTFLKFSQKAERHRVAGAKYGDLRRSLEELDIVSAESVSAAKIHLHKIKKRMDSLALESPELPTRVIKRHGGTDA